MELTIFVWQRQCMDGDGAYLIRPAAPFVCRRDGANPGPGRGDYIELANDTDIKNDKFPSSVTSVCYFFTWSCCIATSQGSMDMMILWGPCLECTPFFLLSSMVACQDLSVHCALGREG